MSASIANTTVRHAKQAAKSWPHQSPKLDVSIPISRFLLCLMVLIKLFINFKAFDRQ